MASPWTTFQREKLQSILNDYSLTLLDELPAIPTTESSTTILDECIHNLRPFWKETSWKGDELSVCMVLISTLCDDWEACHDSRWQDLYGIYALWQGNASSIVGDLWIGASQCCSDSHIGRHHSFRLLYPLLCGEEMTDSEWEERIQAGLNIYAAHPPSDLFQSAIGEEETAPTSSKKALTVEEFRATIVADVFQQQRCQKSKSFVSTLSTSDETNSRAK